MNLRVENGNGLKWGRSLKAVGLVIYRAPPPFGSDKESVSQSEYVSAKLHTDIKIVTEMMIKVHYYEEANWLWMAATSPQACKSKIAQEALLNARSIAYQFGFPRVSEWLSLVFPR